MPKWARILIGFGIVAVVGGLYLWMFGVQTGMALMARYKFAPIPGIDKTPVALPDLSVSNIPHKKVSYSGYELELPWDDVDEQKNRTIGTIHVSYFQSGNIFWFSSFPPKNFVNELTKSAKFDPETLRQVFGEETIQSDYAFFRTMLAVTPRGIGPFTPRQRAVAGSMLLLIKAIAMPKADSGIFAIQAEGFQGFQFENPQSQPFKIVDDLYSSEGGIELMFGLKPAGSGPGISQAEINRVIQSIHKGFCFASRLVKIHPMQTRVLEHGRIALPASIRRKLRLRPGDVLDVKELDGRIVLTLRRRRAKAQILVDPITGLPVLSRRAWCACADQRTSG